MPTERLIIMADSRIGFATSLTSTVLRAVQDRPGITTLAVCDTNTERTRRGPLAAVRGVARGLALRAFGGGSGFAPGGRRYGDLRRVTRRHGVRLMEPAGRNVNSAEFLAEIQALRPTMALSLGCVQIFRQPLLDLLGYAVNFHDGALPAYRGVMATSWSLYRREAYSGYSFHRIEAALDTGPLIETGRVAVEPDEPLRHVLDRKGSAAAAQVDAVLDAMLRRDSGVPQALGGNYYSRWDARGMQRIARPDALSAAELQRRLRCFGLLEMRLSGHWYEVTALRPAMARQANTFQTACGNWLAVHRCMFLPVWLYRLYAAAGRR